MLLENRVYFPEELSLNGHTFAVTKDYWDDAKYKNLKVTTSKQTDYKQCCSYKDNKSYHARLKQAKAIDLRDNADFIDKGNGYGKLVPKDSKKIYK